MTNMQSSTLTLENIGSFLEKLAEKSNSVYWLSSADFNKIQYVSPAFEKIWGHSREDLYRNPEKWLTFLHPDDSDHYNPIASMAERIMRLGGEARYEEAYRIVRPDGSVRWIIDRGFPIFDNSGNCAGVTGVAMDVTSEKKLEEDLRTAKEKAEQANKAKTEFLENMRHDIRTPLNGIIGFAELIKEEDDITLVKEFSNDLVASSRALLEHMNEILEMVRISSGEEPMLKQKFDIVARFQSVVDLLKAKAASKKLRLDAEFDASMPQYIVGDPKRIHRIALELLANALTFTDYGYIKLTIRAENIQEQKFVLRLEVEDTGVGIPPAKQKDIFTHFNRLTPSYQGVHKGLGLGLSIVKEFVSDLEGEIYVTNGHDKGTRFTCLIPMQIALLQTDEGCR